jgi:hypothetical protein
MSLGERVKSRLFQIFIRDARFNSNLKITIQILNFLPSRHAL